jgi:three-Cys-motif partner protein
MTKSSLQIDLLERPNDACRKCPNRESRLTDESSLCRHTLSVLDSLPCRCVGRWANQKIYPLLQYFGIFANGMKNKWQRLNYIEICSGPGRCIVRETGVEQDGTPLAVARHAASQHLDKAVFVDYSEDVIDTLKQRFAQIGVSPTKMIPLLGNFNEPEKLVDALTKHVTPNGLSFVLIDPTDCELPFETVAAIADTFRADLLINIAINTDFNRQAVRVALDANGAYGKARLKYERFLGTPGFFDRKAVKGAAEQNDHRKLRKLFSDEYETRLGALGYDHFDSKSVKHYYRLLFASKHKRGLEFWERANRYDYSGQPGLPGI